MHARADPVAADRDACGVGFIADRRRRVAREWLDRALEALARMTHRGAAGDAVGSADGAGVLTAIPWTMLDPELPLRLRDTSTPRAVGMCFLPPGADAGRAIVERALAMEGWGHAHWRRVPVDTACLGQPERDTCPLICQVFVQNVRRAARARRGLVMSLNRARRRAEAGLAVEGLPGAAIVSLSLDTIVYKALVSPADLSWFYADLAHPTYQTSYVVFHQRFSTNTLPSWPMAQPFHLLAHNGEINTVLGNRLRALRRRRASAAETDCPLAPAVPLTGSDSRSLDGALDELCAAGFTLPHAVARLLPRAWEHDVALSDAERAFERYQAAASDPWEGPAATAFADGRFAGMALDRNGFRPARVLTSADGLVCAASEIGVFDLPDSQTERITRLGPGEMLVVDLRRGRLLDNRRIRRALAGARPYRQWTSLVIAELPPAHTPGSQISGDANPEPPPTRLASPSADRPRWLQRLFGYTAEELELILKPMASEAKEAVGSMGDDTPLAVFTPRRRVLADYFRQRFAQVTNPPIDPVRESLVLSLETMVGRRGSYLREEAVDARVVALASPVLDDAQLRALTTIADRPVAILPMCFDIRRGVEGFEAALAQLAADACEAIERGAVVLVLSDRQCDEARAPLPPLLATAAVWTTLGRVGLGTAASLVVDTGEARDAHQVATLLAFGAGAVCPWLALATAETLGHAARYRAALERGLLRIFSKMGVCTAAAYTGSQLFEVVGFDPRLIAAHFPDTPHVAGGVTLQSIAAEAVAWHRHATATSGDTLGNPGFHSFRRDGDHHVFNPAVVRAFHRLAGIDAPAAYQQFRDLVHARPATTVRDLLAFAPQCPIALDQVEPVESICRRFFASAMSVGALGPEAHRTLAVALNRLGGRSNSGEGGEDPERFVRTSADWANSTTKQVASARFGVTPAYLASAREIQIKMAQGSKPGEGGQLPAEKVVGHIARLRYAQPGTALISPPPHHDIYSIEDLAQLIYDLRSFQPGARINVKLVATLGVGVIAAGVVKAGADAIQISGHSGGTGASPRGSIKHAGLPWEIGLLEAHRLLAARGTRHRVVLQTDGGLVTGHDVAMAAALGADEFGFGTAALVALGCVMARQCHLNTCPVGVATQRGELRQKFAGTVDQVVTYFRLVAAEVRTILAGLGLRSVQELVGRVDLLVARTADTCGRLDVSSLTEPIVEAPPLTADIERHHGPAGALTLNGRLRARAGAALGRRPLTLMAAIRNTDRAVGSTLAGHITRRFGEAGIAGAPVRLELTGTAGQSLGAFGVPGLHISLTGAANDGVGKGLHGGSIAIAPPRGLRRLRSVALIGNAALYGATGGRLFVAGRAGERFAVRNSGARAVVEGVGHHGCEYMTGGIVVVLGSVGPNFAAGMTGGVAYVFDRSGRLAQMMNPEAGLPTALDGDEREEVRELVVEHHERTGSRRAASILARWAATGRAFTKVTPRAEQADPAHLAAPAAALTHSRARAAAAADHPRPLSRPAPRAAGRDALSAREPPGR